MPIIPGPDGSPIPFGAVHHRKEFDAVDGVLPAWLTPVDGSGAALTPTWADTAVGRPGMTVATASATSGLTAGLTTTFSIHSLTTKAAKLTLEGFTLAQPTALLNFGISDGAAVSRGAVIRSEASTTGNMSTVDKFRRYGASTTGQDENISYQINSRLEYNRRRNVGMLLLPPTKEMYPLENDQTFGFRKATDMQITSGGNSGLKPWVRLTSSSAAVVSFTVERLIVEWWT